MFLVGCFVQCEVCHDHENYTTTSMQRNCGYSHLRNVAFQLFSTLFFVAYRALFFNHVLCTLLSSSIAGNYIGAAGCIALSSTLAHLIHLEELIFSSKIVLLFLLFVLIFCSVLCEVCHDHEQYTAATL